MSQFDRDYLSLRNLITDAINDVPKVLFTMFLLIGGGISWSMAQDYGWKEVASGWWWLLKWPLLVAAVVGGLHVTTYFITQVINPANRWRALKAIGFVIFAIATGVGLCLLWWLIKWPLIIVFALWLPRGIIDGSQWLTYSIKHRVRQRSGS
jgi:hypothetical protein